MSPKPSYPGQPRRGGSSLSMTAITVLLIGIVGGALLLHAAGVVKIPFLARDEGPKPPDRTGLVRVPKSGRLIPAYTKVSRDDIWDPKEGSIAAYWMPQKEVSPEMVQDLNEILGHVLRFDKPPGFVFSKTDFYPPGTRPGPTAGVPPGMRAMRLRAAQLPGLHGAKQNDRFDVVMSIRVEVEEPDAKGKARSDKSPLVVEGPYAGLATGTATPGAPSQPAPTPRVQRQRAEVRVVVRNGIVVTPVHERKELATRGSLLRGTTQVAMPIEEIVIAVAPDEVAALNEAIAIGATLSVAMRSGQAKEGTEEVEIPDRIVEFEPEDPATDAAGAGPRVRLVEVIQGGKKKIMAVPEGETPKPAPTTPEGAGTGEK